jgi:WhiB family transcriptional regulator, redox-sensing transcriptional regulator
MTNALSATPHSDAGPDRPRARRASSARLPVYQGEPSRTPTLWWERGMCRGADPGLFFPPEDDARRERQHREEAAKTLCGQCPVRETCLDHALAVPEWFGVWGGTTEVERKAIRQRRTRRPQGADVRG